MIKSIKARWQAWLDGSSTSMFEGVEPTAAPSLRGISGIRDPYTELATLSRQPLRTVRVYELEDPNTAEAVPELATPAQREYEAGLPSWAREALAEMDRVVGAVIREELTEVRTPQYVRRTRRNIVETIDDGLNLTEDTDADQLLERMMNRARRASDAEVTGVIPVVQDDVAEEAWA